MYNPSKVKDVPELIEKYEGKLEKLWQALHTKYLVKDAMAETMESAAKEYSNLTVSVPEDKIPTPTVEQLEELRMRKGAKSYVKYMDSPSQVVSMKTKPTRTYAKVTQQNSGKLKYTYVRKS